MQTLNLAEKLSQFKAHWSPHQIAIVDDMQVLLAKIKDEFVWHKHDDEDELFQVLKGTLIMRFRESEQIVKEGEIIVVPKGVEHCPTTKDGKEVHILLFEKLTTKHTGDVQAELTKTQYPKL
ncbi:MAG TPA: cupin domain-containing protein [Leeuwenhoekiella sp.]|nr:cupin domain-containing protein [Leeuwenhoekiella sp.]